MVSTALSRQSASIGPSAGISKGVRAFAGLGLDDFDRLYAEAGADVSVLPWSRPGVDGGEVSPHPALIAWLNSRAPCLIRPGSRVALPACGLGDDAAELAGRGYDVAGFDAADRAVALAIGRRPDLADCFSVADLRRPPTRWRHRFDLVTLVDTLAWLTPGDRAEAAAGTAELVHPKGALLVIERGEAGPGRPGLAPDELLDLLGSCGISPIEGVDDFEDEADPPVRWLRACCRRSC